MNNLHLKSNDVYGITKLTLASELLNGILSLFDCWTLVLKGLNEIKIITESEIQV